MEGRGPEKRRGKSGKHVKQNGMINDDDVD